MLMAHEIQVFNLTVNKSREKTYFIWNVLLQFEEMWTVNHCCGF